jgi:hypothetical protein
VQLQAEIDAAEFERRLRALEDPIGQIHPEINGLCELIYAELSNSEETSPRIELEEEQYSAYRKPLATIESSGFIKGAHAVGHQFADGFHIADPTFGLYMQAKFGASGPMEELQRVLENTVAGDRLSGHKLSQELEAPLPIVHAFFEIYETKGYGIISQEIGSSLYIAKA